MKRLIAVLLLSGTAAYAAVEGNPDQRPSVGLEYSGAYLSGDIGSSLAPRAGRHDTKDTSHDFMVDVRYPLTSNLTVNVGAGYASKKIRSFDSDYYLWPTDNDLSGPRVKIGVRVYF